MRLIAGLLGLTLLFAWGVQGYRDVTAGGQFILRIRAAADGKTVDQRVTEVEKRLVNVLGDKLRTTDIKVKQAKTRYEIWVKTTLLITATPEDAKASKMSTRQVAENWAKALCEKLPGLSAKL
jgi:hypothetical protein